MHQSKQGIIVVYCIGITGSICSGKSTALTHFKQLGIDSISADVIARHITSTNADVIQKIKEHFGEKVFQSATEINRRLLRQLIIQNTEDKLWLEALLHPQIRSEIKQYINKSKTPYCVVEIPLLVNREIDNYINRVLLIKSNKEIQLHRIIQRDQANEDDANQILNEHEKMNEREKIADDIICNEGSLHDFHHKLNELHRKYLLLSQNSL